MLLLLLGVLAEVKDCSPTQLPCGSTTRGNCLPTSSLKTLPRSSAAISVLYNSLFLRVPSDFWIVNCQFFVPLMWIVCIFGVPFTRTFPFKLCFNFLVGYRLSFLSHSWFATYLSSPRSRKRPLSPRHTASPIGTFLFVRRNSS